MTTIIAVGLVLAACSATSSGTATAGSGHGSRPKPTAVAAGTQRSTKAAGAAAQAAGSSKVDVCGLVSSAQASSIDQVTYGSPTPKHLANGWDQCEYPNTGKHVDPVDIQPLDISVLSIPGCWTSMQSGDGPGQPVRGVGDAAFGYQIGIDIKVGDRCLEIRGDTHAELNNDYSHDLALAHLVLGHLH